MKRLFSKRCRYCSTPFISSASKQTHCSPHCTLRSRLTSLRADKDICWEWPGARNVGSYGVIRVDGRFCLTHRLAYEAFVGPIVDSLYVCHSCDNPPCCNPRHLLLGTHQDNMDDMTKRGRRAPLPRPIGIFHHRARLTPIAVKCIRKQVATGQSMRSLSRQFDVSPETIRKVVRLVTWTHVS